jgi:TatA/E family protein of Tat protein translocase
MFGTMGISELIIILVIVLIIFGAGKLPQIGEGVGKALRGFKKEVNEIPSPDATPPEANQPAPMQAQSTPQTAPAMTQGQVSAAPKPIRLGRN